MNMENVELIINEEEKEKASKWDDMQTVIQSLKLYLKKHGGAFMYVYMQTPARDEKLAMVESGLRNLKKKLDDMERYL